MTASRASVPKPPGRVKREPGWATVDTGGSYQSKFHQTRDDARYDRKTTLHLMDGRFVIRRAVLVSWSSPLKRSKARKGRGS